MAETTIILSILLAVTLAGSIARLTDWPLPFIQIGLGILLAIGPLPSVELDPDIFFLVLLPPLLFLDGWRIPKRELFRDGRLVVALALGLVLFTVVGMGFFISWLIPTMPLSTAFALAAVLSPTDPVAVSAVAARVPMPSRLMHILEGEALFNDASGLVCLRFAIAAAVSGTFAPVDAALTFAWLAAGGIGIGIGATLLFTRLPQLVIARVGEDPGTVTLLSLLIPFGVYLIAERIGASGILAVAAGGVTMSFVDSSGQALALTRMRRTAVWDTVQLAANGALFVLLGEQMPHLLGSAINAASTEKGGVWSLLGFALAINLCLIGLRFVWVWTTVQIVRLRIRWRKLEARTLSMPLIWATSLAGVKGTITLAGILTLPSLLADGSPFPARELAIVLAMSVILLTLLLATFLLPPILSRLHLAPETADDEETSLNSASGAAARRAIEEMRDSLVRSGGDAELYAEAAGRALRRYEIRDAVIGANEKAVRRGREMTQAVRQLQLAVLSAERQTLFKLLRRREGDENIIRRLVRQIDFAETRIRG